MIRLRRLRRGADRARPFARPLVDPLEARALLTVAGDPDILLPSVAAVLGAWNAEGTSATTVSPAVTSPTPVLGALTPAQVNGAYNLPGTSMAGAGITIAIVNAYHNANIQADLATFSARYGLPTASLTVVNQNGQNSSYPSVDSGWALETAMDVEWAHAVAPGAKLVLVEARSASTADLMTAVQTAARMANVVSMSWGGGEFSGQTVYDSSTYFASPNVTYVAASGDDGGISGPSWPATSPYVLGIGGTTLSVSSTGTYQGETSWSSSNSRIAGASGSTGGVSRYEPMPSYQSTALGTRYAGGRVSPDVAMDGNPSSGVSVYSSTPSGGQSGWFKVGGTSAGSPIWAAIVAIADQGRRASGLATLSSAQTISTLYSLYGTSTARAATYATSFHDITSGSNFAGFATSGYDKVTGLGSPVGSAVINALMRTGILPTIRATAVGTTAATTTTGTTTVAFSASLAAAGVDGSPVIVVTPAPVAMLPFPSITTAAPHTLSHVGNLDAIVAAGHVGRALPVQAATPRVEIVVSSSHDLAAVPRPRMPGVEAPGIEPGVGDFDAIPDAPAVAPIATAAWDSALAALDVDLDASASRAPIDENAGLPLAVAPPGTLVATGAAAFVWGLWEHRSRSEHDAGRTRRRPFLPEPSTN